MRPLTLVLLLFAAACGGPTSPPDGRPTVSAAREIESAPPTTPVVEETPPRPPPGIEPVASLVVSELDEGSELVGLGRVGEEWHVSVIARSETDGRRVGRLARHPVRAGRLGDAAAEVTLEHLHAVSVLPGESPWFLERAITSGRWEQHRPVTIRPPHAGIRAGVLARDTGEARWIFSTPSTDRWRADAWRPSADAPDGHVITWREESEEIRMHRVGPRAGRRRVIRVGRASGSARVGASASPAGVAVVYPTATPDRVDLRVQSYDLQGRRGWARDIANPALSDVGAVSMRPDGAVFVVVRRPGAMVLVAFDAAGDPRPELPLPDGTYDVGLFECGDAIHLITAEHDGDRQTMHVRRRQIASDGTLSEGEELLRAHRQPEDPDRSLPDTLEITTPLGSCAEGRAGVAFESTDPRGDGAGRVLILAEWEVDTEPEPSTDGGGAVARPRTPPEGSVQNPALIGHGRGGGCYDCGAGGLENVRPRRIRVTPRAPGVRGDLPPAVVRRVVRRHLRALRACYEAVLLSRPDIEGEVALRWIVRPSGEASPVTVSRTTLGVNRVETCMTDEVRTWRFPPREGEGISVVDVAFTLSREL